MTQTETIVWHKYPDEKPEIVGDYLVSLPEGVQVAYWSQNKRRFSGWKKTISNKKHHQALWSVGAWAKLPNGWKEDE